mmetsp:Transcript_11940/g.13152  ORF Transcript_11940/g.13152 Transcript_11940/m.13152 type:complete len:292 (+) Transcript_11940:99-974(+)
MAEPKSKKESTKSSPKVKYDDKTEAAIKELRKMLSETQYSKRGKDKAELHRFLVAREFNVKKSYDMFIEYLQWMDTYKPHKIKLSQVQSEYEKDKLLLLPHDKQGRPVLLLLPALHTPGQAPMEDIMKSFHYVIQQGIKMMPPGQHKFLIIYDRKGYARKNFDKKMLGEITQSFEKYYPERVGEILVLRTNWLFWALFKLASLVMPAATVKKISILDSEKDLLPYFDEENLPDIWGGKHQLKSDVGRALFKMAAYEDPDEENREEIEEEIAGELRKSMEVKKKKKTKKAKS